MNLTVFANGSKYVVLTPLVVTVIDPPPDAMGNVICPVSGWKARDSNGSRIRRVPLPSPFSPTADQ